MHSSVLVALKNLVLQTDRALYLTHLVFARGFPGRLVISYFHLFWFISAVRMSVREFFCHVRFVLENPWI